MAFIYDAGLRIRPPEPMPSCVEGESAQDYFSRVLADCTLESATSAENASGDSAPTPLNIGQVQADLLRAQEDIAEINTGNTAQQAIIENLLAKYATGVATYALGATTAIATLPSDGVWRIMGIVPLEQALADMFVDGLTINQFVVNFAAAAAAGSLYWSACKES